MHLLYKGDNIMTY